MTVGSKEHYEIMEAFEKTFAIGHRLDKEDKSMWKKGVIYQNGEVNNMFKAYIAGYSAGRCAYLNE